MCMQAAVVTPVSGYTAPHRRFVSALHLASARCLLYVIYIYAHALRRPNTPVRVQTHSLSVQEIQHGKDIAASI